MVVMAMIMSSCHASNVGLSGGKIESEKYENIKQDVLPVHFVHNGEHEQGLTKSAKYKKSTSTVQWTCFDVVIFVTIICSVGFAGWKLLPRKD